MKQPNLLEITQSIIIQQLTDAEDHQIYNIGCYQIGNYIRKDSCGHLYEARKYRSAKSQELGKPVILKSIRSSSKNPDLDELIYHNQIKVLSHLEEDKTSQKLVTHCKTNSQFFIILERDAYGTLREFMSHINSKGQSLTQQEILLLLKEILQACQNLHKKGIIHRNLRLQNIVLGQELSIKITDYSLAKVGQDETFTNVLKWGTINYLPPQLLFEEKGCRMGEEGDVWAIAVIIYYLTYGYFPINPQSISRKPVQIQFQPIKNKDIMHLLQQMLSADSSKRLCIKQLLQSKPITSLANLSSIKQGIMKKYQLYFKERREQKSTWIRHIDCRLLEAPEQIIKAIEKPQKVTILKLIRDKRFGFFVLLSNLKLFAHFNNNLIMPFQSRLIYNATSNQQKILLWMYKCHFARQMQQQKSNIIYQQVKCTIKKLISIKQSVVLIRLTNQTIQAFFIKKGKHKSNSQLCYPINLCINYHKHNPSMIKFTKQGEAVAFESYQKGERHSQYFPIFKNIFQLLLQSSLIKI